MIDQPTRGTPEHRNIEKAPGDRVRGGEPMTGAQRAYLKTLCEEAKEDSTRT